MPDLIQSLQGRDLGHLKIVAELWEIEFSAPDARVGLQRLVSAMVNRARVEAVIESLPGETHAALDDLLRNDGLLPWRLFSRRYGAVREMGPARRDRERPHLVPGSPAEALWYRALVGRSFLDTPNGPEEFAYIPEDLLPLIPAVETTAPPPLGRPASPSERAYLLPTSDQILDDACTLLTALRLGFSLDTIESSWIASPSPSRSAATPSPTSPHRPLLALLTTAGLLDASDGKEHRQMPQPEALRVFLEASRADALAFLARAWMDSASFNELRLLPNLSMEGEWQNDPLRARQAILDFLATVPGGNVASSEGTAPPGRLYWSLPAFVSAIRQVQPDYQRPAGDYDSWFIRDRESGEFLRGFEHWDEVDGALIRFLITGPLHWLGILDLAAPEAGLAPTAFRYSDWAGNLLKGSSPEGLALEKETVLVGSDARIHIPRLAPRAIRYQIARFGEWQGFKDDVYHYRITPASLERARQQGLRPNQLLTLLRRNAASIPPALTRAVERWDEHGSQARLDRVVVLRMSSPDLLQSLRSSRAARFLGELLGPTAVIVKPGAVDKVIAVLAEMGYFADIIEERD